MKKYKINFTKTNSQMIGKTLYANEGLISKKTFLSFASESTLDKYIKSGYLDKQSDGYYKSSSSYNRSFQKGYGQIDKHYSKAYFSQSQSLNHTKGIEQITNSIDRKDLINGVTFKSGGNLTEEFKSMKRDSTFKEAVQSYREQQILNLNSNQNTLDTLSEYNPNYQDLKNQIEHTKDVLDVLDSKKAFSPPDLLITIPLDGFQRQIDYLKNELEEMENFNSKEYHSLENTINQMEQLEERTIINQKIEVTYAVESVTDNYRNHDIIMKENYSIINDIEIVYVRV